MWRVLVAMLDKNEKLLCDYKDELIEKYGYDEEMAENLSVMAESFCDHYGEDFRSSIYNALLSCKVIKAQTRQNSACETVKEVLEKEGMEDTVSKSPLVKEDMKTATVAFKAVPRISHEDGAFKIDRVDRVIVLGARFNWESPASLGDLAREFDKLVNSYLNGYTIEGDTLVIKTGLATRTETLKKTTRGIKRTFASSNGIGLERGMNVYTELKLIRESYCSLFDVIGDDYERLIAGFVVDCLGLGEIINVARLTKDTSELQTVFDANMANGYEAFLDEVDKLSSLEVKRVHSLEDNEALSKISQQISSQFCYSIAPLVREMEANLKSSEVNLHGYKQGS